MEFFLKGFFPGLALSTMVGPIVFALLQTAIERGFRAGIVVGAGVWCSDLLYIAAAYFGVAYLAALSEWQGFEQILGTAGGFILILFGVSSLFSKPVVIPPSGARAEDLIDGQLPDILDFDNDDGVNRPNYFSLFIKGFLVNTVNPFTVFFWTGMVSSVVIGQKTVGYAAFLFFCGIMTALVATDTLKVWAAKSVRHLLSPLAVLWMRRVSGLALIVFGAVLLVQVYKI